MALGAKPIDSTVALRESRSSTGYSSNLFADMNSVRHRSDGARTSAAGSPRGCSIPTEESADVPATALAGKNYASGCIADDNASPIGYGQVQWVGR
ncbi:hypothetical protein GCM10009764_50860 [Nocardia ninae]|uniref:Uncharacterized protein n=1 Tax=Nocardia ninae NBRC 108245 TaxID=1210091 RepID=A0A511M763_9NOCA|nr:hypothetical protein NN4_04770 [Nocardia ninae NBRC 108245]